MRWLLLLWGQHKTEIFVMQVRWEFVMISFARTLGMNDKFDETYFIINIDKW